MTRKKKTEHYKAELDKSGAFGNPIVTAIEGFGISSGQDYLRTTTNNANQAYCSFVIRPKVEKFEKVFKRS
jgi:peptide-methionine (S)-S-oxide reductase